LGLDIFYAGFPIDLFLAKIYVVGSTNKIQAIRRRGKYTKLINK
jgi:hypothetical protein